MSTNKKMCDMPVEFPASGWMAILKIFRPEGGRGLYPLYPVFTAVKLIQDRASLAREEMGSMDIELANELVMLPLTYEKSLPLDPEYWSRPQVKYSQANRIDAFTRMLEKTELHRVLVTPYELVGNKFTLIGALPVKSTEATRDADLFMKMSDFVVNPRALEVALYRPGEAFTLNWITGEIVRASDTYTINKAN